MKILFLHNNFPAQFGRLAGRLADAGWEAWFGTQRADAAQEGLNIVRYAPHRTPAEGVHPYSVTWERAVLNGQAFLRAAMELKRRGFTPDIVVAHSGWGPGLYVKDVWPTAKVVGYFEWYYNPPGPDVVFLQKGGDPAPDMDDLARSRSRNGPILLDLASCDAGICPTHWQRKQFPAVFQSKLRTHHDGIDTDYYAPTAEGGLRLPSVELPPDAEIVTYVARGMEPYRGFPQFMEALSLLQKRRPNCHAVVVGEDRVAYGRKLPEGDSHLKRALEQHELDSDRLHLVGYLPTEDYRKVLRASSVHVYLSAPFVLSWSMMEAMSAGCLLVASDTEPVREVAGENNALLVDFYNAPMIADTMWQALEYPYAFRARREAARETILQRYSADRLIAEKAAFFQALAGAGASAGPARTSASTTASSVRDAQREAVAGAA